MVASRVFLLQAEKKGQDPRENSPFFRRAFRPLVAVIYEAAKTPRVVGVTNLQIDSNRSPAMMLDN